MLIKDISLQHWIDHFYGYGSWQARFWFVAYEEDGGDLPEEVAEKLTYFSDTHISSQKPTLCDIRELYRHVTYRGEGTKAGRFSTLYDYRFGSDAVQNNVWKNLTAFVHGYRQQELPDLFAYQKDLLALPSAHNEALIRLYPLPSPHNHSWYYSWLDLPRFGYLKSRKLYQKHVCPSRIRAILQNIITYKPIVVLMYGMDNINGLKRSVQTFFPKVKFRTTKAIKLHIPQHHLADLHGTTLVITTQIPALRHNRVETGFNWEAFGKMVGPESSGDTA